MMWAVEGARGGGGVVVGVVVVGVGVEEVFVSLAVAPRRSALAPRKLRAVRQGGPSALFPRGVGCGGKKGSIAPRRGSNPRPHGYGSCAMPITLRGCAGTCCSCRVAPVPRRRRARCRGARLFVGPWRARCVRGVVVVWWRGGAVARWRGGAVAWRVCCVCVRVWVVVGGGMRRRAM